MFPAPAPTIPHDRKLNFYGNAVVTARQRHRILYNYLTTPLEDHAGPLLPDTSWDQREFFLLAIQTGFSCIPIRS